jgi:hypothetical protein
MKGLCVMMLCKALIPLRESVSIVVKVQKDDFEPDGCAVPAGAELPARVLLVPRQRSGVETRVLHYRALI